MCTDGHTFLWYTHTSASKCFAMFILLVHMKNVTTDNVTIADWRKDHILEKKNLRFFFRLCNETYFHSRDVMWMWLSTDFSQLWFLLGALFRQAGCPDIRSSLEMIYWHYTQYQFSRTSENTQRQTAERIMNATRHAHKLQLWLVGQFMHPQGSYSSSSFQNP